MKQLAELWGLPEKRHNSAVIARAVERVWQAYIGKHEVEFEMLVESEKALD